MQVRLDRNKCARTRLPEVGQLETNLVLVGVESGLRACGRGLVVATMSLSVVGFE